MIAARKHSDGAADLSIDVTIDSDLWNEDSEAEATIRRAIAEAAQTAGAGGGDLAIVLTDDAAIRALNKQWRGLDKPTNVLSFPALPTPGSAEPPHLGDIVIAFETTADEAERDHKPFAHHLAHLAVHGYLHLLGHDHDDDDDAEAMERLEREILARLGVPDPYADLGEEAATLKSHA